MGNEAKVHDLQIIYLSPDELTPYENNARKHTPTDIDGIKKSILDVGFADPIAVWGENNLIVEGHGRQIAAKELHLDKVPCIRLDQLTDEQRREYTIRHNRSAEMSEWDFETLEEELAKLAIDGIEMGDLDFNFNLDELETSEEKGIKLKEEFQLIIDCEDEEDMQLKYEQLQEMGIECRTSTL